MAGAGVGGECSRRIFGIFARAIDSQELAASSGLRWTDLTADTNHWTTAPWYFAGLFSEIFLCPIFVFDSNTLQETISKRASANVVFSYCLAALNHPKVSTTGIARLASDTHIKKQLGWGAPSSGPGPETGQARAREGDGGLEPWPAPRAARGRLWYARNVSHGGR